ncbi:hypothetical protein [Joostella sp. CR20]|uniref:hypothetical protein n=1 Tax=Joostella sp. CR20 TaxID=2804312 RepID=UPI00313B4E92
MKRILFLILSIFNSSLICSQSVIIQPRKLTEALPSEYPVGSYVMETESDAPYNWKHDAGVLFGFKPTHSNFRHVQWITNANATQFSMRAKNGLNDTWLPWTKIVTESSNGKVGIRASNPTEHLHVIGTLGMQGINPSDLPSKYWRMYHNASSTKDYGLQFHYDKKIKVRFRENDFVFEGLVKAKEVKVQTNVWPDFVFENDYNLPTLEEVEKHIQEKGHLQDIPSAKEVAVNGIHLGEMNAKLLQKIEELMLYTIEQQKDNIELKKQIDDNNLEIQELKILLTKQQSLINNLLGKDD